MKSYLKILFCSVFFLNATFSAISQTNQENELDALVLEMFAFTEQKDYDKLLDLTYPKLFDYVSKDAMKELIIGMFEGNEEIKIEIAKGVPAYVISEIYTIDDKNIEFGFVSYLLDMQMTFLNQSFDEQSKEMMTTMMKVQGMEATFLSDTEVRLLQPNSITIFIKDEVTNGDWYLINYNPNEPIFFELLPVEVIEKANLFKQEMILEQAKKK